MLLKCEQVGLPEGMATYVLEQDAEAVFEECVAKDCDAKDDT